MPADRIIWIQWGLPVIVQNMFVRFTGLMNFFGQTGHEWPRQRDDFPERKIEVLMKKIVMFAGAPPCLFLLYLLSIMPRMVGKPDYSILRGSLFAHRGLFDNNTGTPENSMKAFRKAVEAGYGIELDIHLSKDKIPVVFHDFTLQRMCGVPGAPEDYTLEELRRFRLLDTEEKIPTFREFLDLVDGRVPLLVEIKSEDPDMTICEKVNAMLLDYKGPYCIEAFNPLVLYWFRKHRSDVVRGQLSDRFTKTPEFRRMEHRPLLLMIQFLITNCLCRPDFISFNCKFDRNLSLRFYRRYFKGHSACWTVHSQEEMKALAGQYDAFIFDGFEPAAKNNVNNL